VHSGSGPKLSSGMCPSVSTRDRAWRRTFRGPRIQALQSALRRRGGHEFRQGVMMNGPRRLHVRSPCARTRCEYMRAVPPRCAALQCSMDGRRGYPTSCAIVCLARSVARGKTVLESLGDQYGSERTRREIKIAAAKKAVESSGEEPQKTQKRLQSTGAERSSPENFVSFLRLLRLRSCFDSDLGTEARHQVAQ
jgi:hypothetical protein